VSGEIVLEKLIDTLMRTAIEQAGAERGLLILSQGAEPRIAAEATTGDTIVVQLRDKPVTAVALPESVLHYVVRTNESVILDDATAQNPFSADPYISQHRARSILCLPLLNQDQLTGVLYLENNLAPRVFPLTRIAVLKLLVSQAAIAIENTRLYRDVEQREAKIRRLVDANIVGIFIWDFDGRILEANDAFLRIVRYDREDLVAGRISWADLTPPEWRDDSARRVAEVMGAGSSQPREKEYFRKDGSCVSVLIGGASFEENRNQGVSFVLDLTERKRAEEALRESEERFRSFVDHATDGFFLHDEHLAVLDVNRQACESLGYSREEIIGMHPSDFDAGLDEASIARMGERVKAGETVTFESLHRRKDGTVFPVEIRARQFQHGAHLFRLSLVRDISERKRAEEVLRESEAKLQKAQRIAHFGWWERDFTTNRVSLSDEVCRIFGIKAVDLSEWHGRWLNLIHPDDRSRTAEAAAAALLPGGPRYDVEYRIVRPDAGERIVHSQGDVTWDESGRPLRQFGVLQDITDLRQAEEELRESEERFRTLVQFSFDVYWESDAQHRFTRQEFAEGLADAPASGSEIGKTRWEIPYLQPDAEAWRKHRETLDAHLPFRDFELARPTPDGGKRYVSVSGLPVFDESGRFIGYRGVGRHITDRKKAEEALKRSEAYLAEAQRLSHTGTVAFTAAGPLYWSEESYRIWGLDPLQGLPDGQTLMQRIHPDDRERVNVETEEALRHERDFALEFRIMLPDGTVKYIQSTGRPLFSADGNLVEMVATHVDVTERKRAQEENERLRQLESDLAHVNRISIMGELAASLAHDILHPIATARNNARAGVRFLEMSPPNLDEVKEALNCIVRGADRAKDIVGRVRDHIKKAPPRREPFDLNEAIREVIATVRSAIDQNRVSVRARLTDGLNPVRADRVQLQQVVMNLVLNAVEAMSSVEEGARELSISTKQVQPNDISVAVQDSGPGIDPEHIEQVFAPFYTTKTNGIGMGLSICRSIIAAHGGRLWAETSQPRGAVFQFTLPTGLDDS
jgi:PAS domain S-box-containing protein